MSLHREESKHLTYEEKQRILNMVETLVTQYPEMQTDVIERCTRGMRNRYEAVNEMRVDAESALVMLIDMIPASKQQKHPSIMNAAKRACIRSGAYGGTEFAKKLEAEIKEVPDGA